jgi:hypothetical protein
MTRAEIRDKIWRLREQARKLINNAKNQNEYKNKAYMAGAKKLNDKADVIEQCLDDCMSLDASKRIEKLQFLLGIREVRISELEREIGLLKLTLSQSVAGRKNAEDAYVNLESMYLNTAQERDLLQPKIDSGVRVLVIPEPTLVRNPLVKNSYIVYCGDDKEWGNKHNATLIFDNDN